MKIWQLHLMFDEAAINSFCSGFVYVFVATNLAGKPFQVKQTKNMDHHSDLSDFDFAKQFENCTLNPEIFSHEAHLRLAWIHINKYGSESAIQTVCAQLLTFVDFVGATDKYNKTLTIAAVKAVNHFMQKSNSKTFTDFIDEFPRLTYNFKELMGSHYRIDIYNSESAKKKFLEPDLLPFD